MKWNPAYTPGPWTPQGSSGAYSVFAPPHGMLAANRYLGNSAERMNEERANVEVMALAPELVEALRFALPALQRQAWSNKTAIDIVEDALARVPQKP